jgi:hypothetical protein
VPSTRWLYSNREFFIDLEPAMMELVSLRFNVPELLRFQARGNKRSILRKSHQN